MTHLMQTKGNFLKNIKTLCMNMLSPTKKVLFEYMTLLAKMAKDHVEFHITQTHFDFLSKNVILLGVVKLLPLLEIIHALIKFWEYSMNTFLWWLHVFFDFFTLQNFWCDVPYDDWQ